MYAQVAIKLNTLLRNGAYGIVMRGVQKCTRGCSSLRDRKRLPLCCIKLDTATDPACGSGNFLTETYLSLRRLENRAIASITSGQMTMGEIVNPIKVQINQFYGIEINDFAVTVAKTALWIAESQMFKATEDLLYMHMDFLPLKTNANIIEGNALRLDWNRIVSRKELSYFTSNPPFIGYSLQSHEQKKDMLSVYTDESGKPYPTAGKIDYVAGWYFKAAQYMAGTNIHAAFVSTNSITQGEQVPDIWKPMVERFNTHIDFAYRTFVWDSEANNKAHVHCVIIGFSDGANTNTNKVIYDGAGYSPAKNINTYLLDGPNVFITSRNKPLCDVPEMIYGNKPTDGGAFFLTEEEFDDVKRNSPEDAQYIHQVLGATEFINGRKRYCLWLDGVSPAVIKSSQFIMNRIQAVKAFREASPKAATQKSAATPSLFQEIRQPKGEYIIVPRHSSQTRRYIPIGFVSPDVIVNDAVQIIPNANIYDFGILTSNVHMAWMRAICGRIKSDYRYSKDVVYNNFPWPSPTSEQKSKIEQTAQSILDARALYPDSSLADLYDPLTMPVELQKAHTANDRAVMEAYGFSTKMSEMDCVAALMKLYQRKLQD